MTLYEEIVNGLKSGIDANDNNVELKTTTLSLPERVEDSEIKEN